MSQETSEAVVASTDKEAGAAESVGPSAGQARSDTQPDSGSSPARSETLEVDSETETAPAEAGAAPPRRRRRRGGRGRGRGRASLSASPDAPLPVAEPEAGRLEAKDVTRAPREAPEEVATGDVLPQQSLVDATGASQPESEEAPAPRRRRRRGGRGRARSANVGEATGGTGEDAIVGVDAASSKELEADVDALPATGVSREGATKLEEEPPSRDGASRDRRRRPPWQRRRETAPRPRRVRNKTMLVTELGERHQIAVLEDRQLVEHYITRSGAHSMVGSIFLGKVQNVLPGMEAAFIDIGRGRNAVLYAGELSYDEDIEGEAPRIEQLLKSGKNVIVQVTKDPIGGKGPRLTQQVSLPGRYLVFVPNSEVFGISRRLPDRERARLKDALRGLKPEGHGVIVRTAAEGAEADELQADLSRLTETWAGIEKSAKRGRAPRLLYEEPELTVRVVRDLFTGGEFKDLVTDSQEVYQRVTGYLSDVAPDLVDCVRMHEGPLPLLEAFHVLEQIHKALDRKVWLPSGGYIVIDRTEAMTVIDVNTGRHVGKASLEETVTKTNLEAAEEIARQLRLRDIGGIIIIDFIDMLLERNRDKLVQTLKNALAEDKTRSQVFEISALGILEVTRKRISAGLLESFSQTCPTCEGRGILLTNKI